MNPITSPTPPTAIVVGLIDPTQDRPAQVSSLNEAKQLLKTYGARTLKVITQNLSHHNQSTLIGSGKVQEINELIAAHHIDIVVINHQLKSGQLYTLTQALTQDHPCQVWDRTELILHIFSAHAHTAEAKLQIELATLKHHGPELSGIGTTLSQQGGGIGTRGLGETTSEIKRRHWKEAIRTVESKLAKVSHNRLQQIKNRQKNATPTVSIIGYTNAGKTALFNALTNKGDKVQNALFATLDSSVSSLYLPGLGQTVFISDTIGFIQDLPPTLIDAFRSTLMETTHAKILLEVIDCSDSSLQRKMDTVKQIIGELQVDTTPHLYVFNKIDLLTPDQIQQFASEHASFSPLLVSAARGQGMPSLISAIESELLSQGYQPAPHLLASYEQK